jgi:hypothetical protein
MCFNYLGGFNETSSSLHNRPFMVGSTFKLKTSLPRSRISHLDIVCYFMEHAIHKCTYNTLDVTHT